MLHPFKSDEVHASVNTTLELSQLLVRPVLPCECIPDTLRGSEDDLIRNKVDESTFHLHTYRPLIQQSQQIVKSTPPRSEVIEDHPALSGIAIEPEGTAPGWSRKYVNIILVQSLHRSMGLASTRSSIEP